MINQLRAGWAGCETWASALLCSHHLQPSSASPPVQQRELQLHWRGQLASPWVVPPPPNSPRSHPGSPLGLRSDQAGVPQDSERGPGQTNEATILHLGTCGLAWEKAWGPGQPRANALVKDNPTGQCPASAREGLSLPSRSPLYPLVSVRTQGRAGYMHGRG